MANPQSAANAYASMARINALAPAPIVRPDEEGSAGGDFAGLLKQVVGNTADSGRKAEASMAQAVSGKGDLVDVVTAIAESEAALETLVATRDRVIAAYEEIMRMPI